jgi:hypothetical protein
VPYTSNNGVITEHTFANLVTATPLVPEEAMGAFSGENPNGTWTLTVSDDAGGDGGSINGWSLEITTISTCVLACALTCPTNVTVNNTTGQCGAVVEFALPTTTGACGVVTCSPAPGSFFNVGTTPVTCSSDAGATCMFTVTVNDTQPPAITCPANVVVGNDLNQCGAVVNYPAPGATDNCPGVTTACVPASGTFFNKGTTNVSCTATDASMNTATCGFTVTVNDTQPPSITCPANIVVGNDLNQCGAVVTFAPTASDNCPGVTTACVPASGSFFNKGTTTVTCTATDASGNTAQCSFTVTVNDVQPPAIVCPANVTVFGTGLNGCTVTAVVTYPPPTVSDNCPGVTAACVPASGSTFQEGTTVVTCTATDASGNTASCTFTVTVGAPFGVCVVDDFSGDTFSQVVDKASPLYGFWRYRVAAKGLLLCGTSNSIVYTPGRQLISSTNNSPVVFESCNLNFATNAGTVTVKDITTNTTYTLRDRNLANDPPCGQTMMNQ